MDFIKRLKKWFTIDEPTEEQEEVKVEKPIEELNYKDVCCYCESEIKEDNFKKKFNGSNFHKQCYKQMKKDVKKNGVN